MVECTNLAKRVTQHEGRTELMELLSVETELLPEDNFDLNFFVVLFCWLSYEAVNTEVGRASI
jgi:hypothetical protein